MTNIILVEDHASFRGAVATILDREPGLNVVAQAGSLAEANRLLTEELDVAVVDLGLPDGSGVEFIKGFRELKPERIALVLSGTLDPGASADALEAGATEVLDKSDGVVQLVGAVRRHTAG